MNPAQSSNHENPTGYAREVYSVDGMRVTFEATRGWQCNCEDRAQGLSVTDVVKASALQQIRSTQRDDDVIALELSAKELEAIARASFAEQDESQDLALERKAVGQRVELSRGFAVLALAAVAALS